MRLVKGSHIVTRKLFDHDHAYIFQNHDRRIVFAIPWQGDYTLIGTTDVDYQGSPAHVQISSDEIAYLCDAVSRYFRNPVRADDVVWTYAGVRPLLEDGADDSVSATRDYQLDLDTDAAPLMTVFGGKITTYRKLAEQAADELAAPLGLTGAAWTHQVPLPGGDIPEADFTRFMLDFGARHRFLPTTLVQRFARAYGTRADPMLDGILSMEAMGQAIVPGLYEAEARYLVDQEWARCADDILWRRTKLGLKATASDRERLETWLREQHAIEARTDFCRSSVIAG
jgi:glycerol-3-phosphate dehydrogenase